MQIIEKPMSLSDRLLLTLMIAAGATASARAEPSQYLCATERAGGLHFDRDAQMWRAQEFGARKYVLRRLTDADRDKNSKWGVLLDHHAQANWAFFEYGKENPMPLTACVEVEEGLGQLSRDFRCRPIVHDAHFDKETRRFEVVVSGGYVTQGFWEQFRRETPAEFAKLLERGGAGDPSKPDDLYVEVGTCSPS
jgi:hypothetical protein